MVGYWNWYGMVPYPKDRNLREETSLLAAIKEATVEGQTVCIVDRSIVTATGVITVWYGSIIHFFFFDKF